MELSILDNVTDENEQVDDVGGHTDDAEITEDEIEDTAEVDGAKVGQYTHHEL